MADANAQDRATEIQNVTGSAPVVHEDITVKWFLLSSVAYFFIVGIVAVVIAAKFVWAELLSTVAYFTYGRMRPLHVNGMLFGWLLACDMALIFYLVPRLREQVLERLAGALKPGGPPSALCTSMSKLRGLATSPSTFTLQGRVLRRCACLTGSSFSVPNS